MDFRIGGERFQEATGWPTLPDAERVAEKRVRELKELKQGLQTVSLTHQKTKVLKVLESVRKVWDVGTPRTANLLAAYTQIAAEQASGYHHEGLWLMCITECEGDDERATLLYNRRRAEMLAGEQPHPPSPEV